MPVPEDTDARRRALRHVYWIGGPPDAGKSTVGAMVAAAMGAHLYRQDGEEREHIRRASPDTYPLNARLRAWVTSLPEPELYETIWLRDSADALARDARATWEERIGLVCEDLLALPANRPIVAEGPGFFPGVILRLISRPNQAIWLVPTGDFKRESHQRREKSAWRSLTSDPDRAMANHIERDLNLADMYREDLANRDLPWIDIDGSEDADTIARRVMAWFAGALEG